MNTFSASYGDWFILAVPLEGEWVISCLPPKSNNICTDWKTYQTAEAALAGAQEYVEQAAAAYALAEVVLELYEADKIELAGCQNLLRSLGYF
ncbi:hypothetical protein [[Phormidium] sp. ETS-05]|uniref:hypothetical protein n=1 Tax=[Phormidium] sp. ETS-05 TaxID=222819 RepID=UPI0018EEEEC0|nr:hypothetical protein [[Phormidium] sp. ETS-05]